MDEKEKNYLSEEHLEFRTKVADWKEAIKVAAQPLLTNQIIEQKYISAMIENVLKFGDYMVLVPKVAMPHARPESGALKTGFSILKLEEPVVFGESQEVYLIICLATNDNQEHLTMLQKISALFDEEEKVDALLKTTSKKEFITLSEEFIHEEEEDDD